jgi:hypothetical protein
MPDITIPTSYVVKFINQFPQRHALAMLLCMHTTKSQASLNSKPSQNQHGRINQPPDKRDPRTHTKVSRIIHTTQQRPRDAPRQQPLHGGDQRIDEPDHPHNLPVFAPAAPEHDDGVRRRGDVQGAEEEEGPDDGEAPDVGGVVQVVGVGAEAVADGEGPVEARKGWCFVVERSRVLGREGVDYVDRVAWRKRRGQFTSVYIHIYIYMVMS